MLNFFTFYFEIYLIATKKPDLICAAKKTLLNFPYPNGFIF
jgi:hypothetical protein